jgi:hypothetical protein
MWKMLAEISDSKWDFLIAEMLKDDHKDNKMMMILQSFLAENKFLP